jgi:chromosome segregation ATPase
LRKLVVILLAGFAWNLNAPAQEANPAPGLAERAAKADANWEALAKGLDAKIQRMLPCDPRLTAAIEEVSQASQARLAAMNQYLQAAVARARQDTETARLALVAEQASARDLETDRAEAEQERIAIEGQLSDLTDSVKRRPSLEEARAKLQSIEESVAARARDLQSLATKRTPLAAALSDLVQARQARQRALEAQLDALALETLRWGDYYAARLARARTECEITNPVGTSRRKR